MRNGIAFMSTKPLGSETIIRPTMAACKWIEDFRTPTALNSCERGGTQVTGLFGRSYVQPNERIGDTTDSGRDISGLGRRVNFAKGRGVK